MIHGMRAKLQKGSLTEILLVILGVIVVIFVLIGKSGVPGTNTPFLTLGANNNNFDNSGSPSTDNSSLNASLPTPTRTSPYAGKIHLGSGNAAYEIQPSQEYITVENDSATPIDITGWKISNGAGLRTYPVGGNQETFASDVVTIPQGSALISSVSNLQDIVLKPNESAALTTGSIGTSYPYKITTFKENECTGYLTQQNIYSYSFSPSLEKSCVAPRNEPGSNGLDLTCQNFIAGMQSCHTPKYNTVDSQGNTCSGCVDGNSGLSNACVAYLQTHFSYDSCLANHENDPNFYGTVWHVYLGRSFELWAANHELITLYDSSGKVVDYLSY